MAIQQIDLVSATNDNQIELTVAVENQTYVRVSSGTFKCMGVDYELTADDVHECTVDATYDTHVMAFLCWNTVSEAAEVVVDELLLDGVDVAYKPDSDADRDALFRLYDIFVPAGATDISSETLRVRHIHVDDQMETEIARS